MKRHAHGPFARPQLPGCGANRCSFDSQRVNHILLALRQVRQVPIDFQHPAVGIFGWRFKQF
jgi:hypothetical protein